MAYETDGGSGTSYSDAGTVSGDVVLTQTQYVYDADGNTIETITSDRFSTDSTTATGALGTPTSGLGARVYYEGYLLRCGRPLDGGRERGHQRRHGLGHAGQPAVAILVPSSKPPIVTPRMRCRMWR